VLLVRLSLTRNIVIGVNFSLYDSWWHQFWDYFDWDEINVRQKITTIIDLPRLIIQHLTIPWAIEERYFRPFHVLHPIAIVIFCFTAFQAWDFQVSVGPLWPWMLGVGVLLSVFIFFTTTNYDPPGYNFVCSLLGSNCHPA